MEIEVWGRYSKTWEGRDPFVVLQFQTRREDAWYKASLILDARTQTIVASPSKPEGLHPTGSLAALLRKHAPSGGLGTIWRNERTGDIWLPLFTQAIATPSFYLQLAAGSPSEIRLIQTGGLTLVRRSSKGSYTKPKANETLLPHEVSSDHADWCDITATLQGLQDRPTDAAATATSTTPTLLPDFQRSARDRLARRLKTLKKTLQNHQNKSQDKQLITELIHQAALLSANLHQVEPGATSLNLDGSHIELDPKQTPGQNLDKLYLRIKKAKKSLKINLEQAHTLQSQTELLAADLARLRAEPLSQTAVEHILAKYKLASAPPTRRDQTGITPVAQAWRQYLWETAPEDSSAQKIPILVGKSAAGSDALCRAARGNDWWLHAVGTTGSHVIIPARALRGTAPSTELIRAAAILALNFSQRRDDYRGEVYVSRRQHIRKRPGMAAGLWQIDKAETLFISYDDAELQKILASPTALGPES